MNAISVDQVNKIFGNTRVVDNVSFEVEHGEIFGMVGPNGAGKTTTLRMLMDIIKPDSGGISILGETINEGTKNRIGYLPEERGLYKKITVMETLTYLAALKNIKRRTAKERAAELLTRVDMLQHKNKKIEELSRGMGQIIQFIATVLHNPDLVVLDEPFSGLDPVNTELLKRFILDLRNQGKTTILSTHQMNQVEELCDRFLMINKGQAVLYGSLDEIKSRFRNNSIFLECDRIPDNLPGVVGSKDHGKYLELFLDGATHPSQILSALVNYGTVIDRYEVSTPSLNEIFIQVVKQDNE
jgi:ABC-2 type transport system ATP-binding protein